MIYEPPEFDVRDCRATDAADQYCLEELQAGAFRVLGEYHTPGNSFYILHDTEATWGAPGSAELRAVRVLCDLQDRTYQIFTAEFPLYVMAESWLIARGFPDDIARPDIHRPADDITRALEARVRRDGDQFALIYSYVSVGTGPSETAVMLRSLQSGAGSEFRILLERHDEKSGAHTLREGGFETYADAYDWWGSWSQGNAPPLPAPAPSIRRATTGARPSASLSGPRQLRF